MSNEFFSWRAKHFVKVTDYSWRARSPEAEKLIRNQLALHAVAIKLEDAVKGIPEPLYSEYRFQWDDAHFKRIGNAGRQGVSLVIGITPDNPRLGALVID